MNDYPDIIKAAFPPEKAQRILQREQQQRGIVASTVNPVQRPAPAPSQRIRPVQPIATQPPPAPPVVVYQTQPHTENGQHNRTIGRVALLFLLSWLGM